MGGGGQAFHPILYADPGTVVTLTVRRTVVGTASVPSFPCSLSGYYVDAT
jgi:hypothetical protein